MSADHRCDVDPDAGEPVGVRGAATGVYQLTAPPGEHRLGLDDVALHPAGDGHHLVYGAPAVGLQRELDHQVDRRATVGTTNRDATLRIRHTSRW